MRSSLRRALPPLAILLAVSCSAGAPMVSEQGEDFQGIWRIFLVIAIGVVLLIWGLVVFCVIRYRRRDDTLPEQGGTHLVVEIAAAAVPLVLVIGLFWLSVDRERDITALSDEPDLVVEVVAYRWDWQFTYVDRGVEVIGVDGEAPVLRLPVGRTVRFELETADVIHSFWVPEFGTKLDMIPRVDNALDIDVTEAGHWTGRCAEYCGLDHASMDFAVEAMPADEFDAWLDEESTEGATP